MTSVADGDSPVDRTYFIVQTEALVQVMLTAHLAEKFFEGITPNYMCICL